MPTSVRTSAPTPKNVLVVQIGSVTQSRFPCAVMMASEESDISETSNSWCVSCRWNVSAGPDAVGMSSMPSGLMVPSMMGRLRGLGANARLNVGLVVMERSLSVVVRCGQGVGGAGGQFTCTVPLPQRCVNRKQRI